MTDTLASDLGQIRIIDAYVDGYTIHPFTIECNNCPKWSHLKAFDMYRYPERLRSLRWNLFVGRVFQRSARIAYVKHCIDTFNHERRLEIQKHANTLSQFIETEIGVVL